ncbi:hypothetical protein QFC20_007048 [Naganishia adeliensis]|uniref:Uncharacterized protein n=1 Tax=Naganishia adeliensis TaxID=92952 RepID=A0ACC2V5C9_9TREE|nr:hypothetical protein QFC20_007048 [Naganishia adeliensis]
MRVAPLFRKPFFTGERLDIPRFDIHWPIREIVKTVLYNQKKAKKRIIPGIKDVQDLYDALADDLKARLCDAPVTTVLKVVVKEPGSGPGSPRK